MEQKEFGVRTILNSGWMQETYRNTCQDIDLVKFYQKSSLVKATGTLRTEMECVY
jgi:hypothetical protein